MRGGGTYPLITKFLGFTSAEKFLLRPKNQRKSAFTLAEGATHVAMPKKSGTFGFTLAEVLITLGIIGVVAALTMPTLIANHKKRVFSVKARKTYSTIVQAIKLYQAKAEAPGDVTGLFNPNQDSLKSTEAFSKYFNVVKLCTEVSPTCGRDENGQQGLKYRYGTVNYNAQGKATGPIISIRPDAFGYFYLDDGTMIAVRQGQGSDDGKCQITETGTALNPDGTIKKDENGQPIKYTNRSEECVRIYFDTNGYNQGPNQLGLIHSGWV